MDREFYHDLKPHFIFRLRNPMRLLISFSLNFIKFLWLYSYKLSKINASKFLGLNSSVFRIFRILRSKRVLNRSLFFVFKFSFCAWRVLADLAAYAKMDMICGAQFCFYEPTYLYKTCKFTKKKKNRKYHAVIATQLCKYRAWFVRLIGRHRRKRDMVTATSRVHVSSFPDGKNVSGFLFLTRVHRSTSTCDRSLRGCLDQR